MSEVRFEVVRNPEPDDNAHLYLLRVFDAESGEELESFYCEDPYGHIEAYREVETIPLEERWAMYAERGW